MQHADSGRNKPYLNYGAQVRNDYVRSPVSIAVNGWRRCPGRRCGS